MYGTLDERLKTLTLFAYVNPNARGAVYVSDPQAGGPDHAHLLRSARPGLIWVPGKQLVIGRHRFTAYGLRRPVAGDVPGGTFLPIPADSPLLAATTAADSADPFRQAQELGADVFRRLAASLAAEAGYRHPHFNLCLLALLRHYVPLVVTAVARRQWQFLVATDKALCDAAVGLLRSIPDDEPGHRGRLGRVLGRLAGAGELDLHGTTPEAVIAAVDRLKSSLLSGVIDAEADPALAALAANPALGFLRNWATAPEAVPGLTAIETGEVSFPAFFVHFAAASWANAALVRAGPLLTQMAAYISAKYRAHGVVDVTAAAVEMHRLGVAEQADPSPGETLEAQEETRGEIARAAIAPSIGTRLAAATVGGESAADVAARYMSTLEAALAAPLETPRAFTRQALARWLRDVFLWRVQMVGGTVGQIIADVAAMAVRMAPIHRRILSLGRPDGGPLTLEFARSELEAKCTTAEQKGFLSGWFPQSVPEGADVKRAVKKAFAAGLGAAGKNTFAERFLGSLQQVDNELAAAGQVFQAQWPTVNGKPGEPGVAGPAVGPRAMAWAGEFPGDAEARARKLAEVARAAAVADAPGVLFTNASAAAERALPDGVSVPVEVGGQAVGCLRRDGAVVSVTPASADVALLILSEDAVAGEQRVPVSALDLRGLEPLAPFGQPGADPRAVAAAFGLLESTDQATLEKVRDPGTTPNAGEVAEQLRRATWATILAEHAAAATPDAVTLDTPDVSKPLALVLEFVRHAADARDGADLFRCEPSPRCAAGLARIDLSRIFPVPADDPGAMADALNYLYAQCAEIGNPDLREYLAEIGELDAVMRAAARLGFRVALVNDTLAGNTAAPSAEDFAPVRFGSAVVYLTRQAFADPGAAAADVAAFARRTADALRQPAFADRGVTLPVIVTPVDVGGSSAALPVLDRTTFQFPQLVQGRNGVNPSVKDDPRTVVTRLVHTDPRLMAAVSLLGGEQADFGRFPRGVAARLSERDEGEPFWNAPDQVRLTAWGQGLGVDPAPGTAVARALHKAWDAADTGTATALFEALASASLVTLAAYEFRRRVAAGETDIDFAANFGTLLAAVLADPEAARAALRALPAGVRQAAVNVEVGAAGGFARPAAGGPAGALGTPLRVRPRANPAAPVVLTRMTGPNGWLTRFARLVAPGG